MFSICKANMYVSFQTNMKYILTVKTPFRGRAGRVANEDVTNWTV